MQPLAQGAYTDAQVRARLHGPRTVGFRYDLLDVDGTRLGALSTVQSASVAHGALDDIPRTAKIDLGAEASQVNYARHRVRPWWRLQMPDGGWCEWPLGVFLLSTPTRNAASGKRSTRSVEAYDLTAVLEQDLVPARVTVDVGTNVVSAAVAQLAASGITQVSAEPSAAVVPTALEWPPGTSRRQIVQELLGLVNYARLWFDGFGSAVLRPYRSPTTQAPGYRYADDAQSVTVPAAADTLDLYAVPNRWIAVVSEPERDPLVSVYTNTAAGSPTSTVSRGRTVATLVDGKGAVDQATLDAYVARVALEASQVYRKVTFDTATMPHHEHSDVLDLSLVQLGVVGMFSEVGWSMDLQAGGKMTHTVRQLVAV